MHKRQGRRVEQDGSDRALRCGCGESRGRRSRCLHRQRRQGAALWGPRWLWRRLRLRPRSCEERQRRSLWHRWRVVSFCTTGRQLAHHAGSGRRGASLDSREDHLEHADARFLLAADPPLEAIEAARQAAEALPTVDTPGTLLSHTAWAREHQKIEEPRAQLPDLSAGRGLLRLDSTNA